MNFLKSTKDKTLAIIATTIIILSFIACDKIINHTKQHTKKEIDTIAKILFEEKRNSLNIAFEEKINALLYTIGKTAILFKNKDREKLYKVSHRFFKTWKKINENIEIITFRLKDGSAFLRVHKPNMYGDKLNKSRKIITDTNRLQKIQYGFEIGKLKMNYRIVVPIFVEKEYIGLVEIGINPQNFADIYKKNFKFKSAIAINKKLNTSVLLKTPNLSTKKQDFLVVNENKKNKALFENINFKENNNEKIYNNIPYFIHTDLNLLNNANETVAKLLLAFDISEQKKEEENIILTVEYFTILFLIIILLVLYIAFGYYDKKLLANQLELEKKNDILEKQKHKLKESSRAKSEFLANMSHEIRTPLNAINGFIDLLKEESIGEKALDYVNIIDDSSKNLLKIIEDILDFSKIESGKLEIDKINFDTKKEFGIISHLFEAKCSQKDISLVLNLNENLPKTINTDPLRIKQIIANLLSNAVKFTESGKKIIIDINYENNNLFVSIKDEGIGIAENKLEHIFEAFSQEDTSTTRKYGGTGLGLTISNKLVKLLGGSKLKVKSTVEKGSEFYFYIPVKIGKDTEDKKDDKAKIDFKDKKILVVEDNQANQIFMKILLKKIHIKVEIANDGVEAIEAFKNKKYDAILMDENMPNMNGIEATKKILEYEKQNNLTHTPIIALTANALKGDRERFLEAGMDEYLSKPVSKKDLKNVLSLLID